MRIDDDVFSTPCLLWSSPTACTHNIIFLPFHYYLQLFFKLVYDTRINNHCQTTIAMCQGPDPLSLKSSKIYHVRPSSDHEQVKSTAKSHRRFLSTDSFFFTNDVVEGREPSSGVRNADVRQSTAQDAGIKKPKSRRSQSVVPSLLQDSTTFQPFLPVAPETKNNNQVLPPQFVAPTETKRRVVHFAPSRTVRQYEDVTVGDLYSPNYDGSMSYGLPISLGWNYQTRVEQDFVASFSSPNKRRFESAGKLRPKQRFAILKEKGGYSDKELWKMERDLTLRDRCLFFEGISQ